MKRRKSDVLGKYDKFLKRTMRVEKFENYFEILFPEELTTSSIPHKEKVKNHRKDLDRITKKSLV